MREKDVAGRFFAFGMLSELVLLLLAGALGYLLLGDLLPFSWNLSPASVLAGVAAAAPMALLVLLVWWDRGRRLPAAWRWLQEATEGMRAVIAPSLRDMSLWQVVLLSSAAGLAEEILFRGVLQALVGILVASVVFGLFHALTGAFFVFATLVGIYLGWLYEATGNLVVPIVAHAAYDVFALLLLRRIYAPPL